MRIELKGLELHGYHGVEQSEQERGQTFLFDLWLDVPETGSDRIEDAVDYRLVAECVREVSSSRVDLLETLAATLADALMARFPLERARVRVRKPEVRPAGLDVEYSAVTVTRER